MESMNSPEPINPTGFARRISEAFIAGVRFVGHKLSVADLNPNEGKLRGSSMPSEYMYVPDYPPVHDDTI